jgi:Asp-tRNA(Asn)/Glu-tRNA(Gln) amidotransferase A subunit family amidase
LSGSPDPSLLAGLDAVALRERLVDGELSCVELTQAFLEAVGDDDLRAWAAVDADVVLARAATLDQLDQSERRELALFGLPVGIKDCFDTADYPTAYGSPIYDGHRPDADAAAVQRLRAAGAIIAGKTKCAEFAWMFPSDTVNPLDGARTPGGSSSGSAVAVAAGTVPITTGTQTAGSINRPASYCAVLGYKPTFGSLPRAGVKPLAASLDTVGLFARSVGDLRLVAAVLAGSDPGDPTLRTAQPFDLEADRAGPPRIGFARTPEWAAVEPEARAAVERLALDAENAGATIEEVELPGRFSDLLAAQTTIQWAESVVALAPELGSSPELLSDELRAALGEGAEIGPERYVAAKLTAAELTPQVVETLGRFDCVLTPSSTGVPPLGLGFTGDPMFCRAWTLIGAPCVSVPLAWTEGGLPVGVQVVGAPFSDGLALSCAAWMLERASPPAAGVRGELAGKTVRPNGETAVG